MKAQEEAANLSADEVTELVPSDVRFKRLVSYKTYRLRDKLAVMGPRMASNMYYYRKNLKNSVQDNVRFDGNTPTAAIRWLEQMATAFDDAWIPECAAWQIAKSYLEGEANDTYVAAMERRNNTRGGFNTWPGAVNHILETYVTNTNLNMAIEEVEFAKQADGEPVMKFFTRLQDAARLLGDAYDQPYLMSIFARGLTEELGFLAEKYKEKFTGPRAFRLFAEEAEAHQKSQWSLLKNKKNVRINEKSTALLANADHGGRAMWKGIRKDRDPVAVVGDHSGNRPNAAENTDSTPSTKTTSPPQTSSPRPNFSRTTSAGYTPPAAASRLRGSPHGSRASASDPNELVRSEFEARQFMVANGYDFDPVNAVCLPVTESPPDPAVP